VLEQTQGLHLQVKFHLNVFIVSASGGQKRQFWANFNILGLLYRPPFSDEGHICCALADPRCTLTRQIWRNRAHNSDVQTRDGQTNRQTDWQKTQRFWPPRRRVKSEPHRAWHGDRDLEHVLAYL